MFCTLSHCGKPPTSRLTTTQNIQFNWEEAIRSLGSSLKADPELLLKEVEKISNAFILDLDKSTTIEDFLKQWLPIDEFQEKVKDLLGSVNLKTIQIKLNYPLKRIPVLPIVVFVALMNVTPDQDWLSEVKVKLFLSKLKITYRNNFLEADYQDYLNFEKFMNEFAEDLTQIYLYLLKIDELADHLVD
jgi:hypothetical protein